MYMYIYIYIQYYKEDFVLDDFPFSDSVFKFATDLFPSFFLETRKKVVCRSWKDLVTDSQTPCSSPVHPSSKTLLETPNSMQLHDITLW